MHTMSCCCIPQQNMRPKIVAGAQMAYYRCKQIGTVHKIRTRTAESKDSFFFRCRSTPNSTTLLCFLLLLLLLSGVLMVLASGVMLAFDQKQSLLIADVKSILYDRLLSFCWTLGRQIVAFGKKSADIGQHILATFKIGVVPERFSLLAFWTTEMAVCFSTVR